ncbi:MAG: SGNH/GDSL hydrolase family protein [Limisphaerales bacterium]
MNDNSEPRPPEASPGPAPLRGPSRRKRLAQNLALSGFVFVLCFVVLELVLRIAGYGNLEIYAPDEKLFWRLKPNQQCFTKVNRKPVRVNSHGTRGPEFPVEKPPGTIRILSLGDSRTFGWGLSEAETYSGRLQAVLQERLGNSARVEVINAGVNAWSYPQMLVYFRERGLAFSPDVVVLADANLWTQFSEQSSPEFVRSFLRRVWLKNFLRRFATYHYFIEIKLRDYYERHRSKFIPVDPKQDTLFKDQQQADPDAVFRDAIENLCRLAQSNGVVPVLVNLPIEGDWTLADTPAPLRAKRLVAERLGVTLVDLTPEIKASGAALYLEADPVHFNAQGNEIIAARLAEVILPLLARPATTPPPP